MTYTLYRVKVLIFSNTHWLCVYAL